MSIGNTTLLLTQHDHIVTFLVPLQAKSVYLYDMYQCKRGKFLNNLLNE